MDRGAWRAMVHGVAQNQTHAVYPVSIVRMPRPSLLLMEEYEIAVE